MLSESMKKNRLLYISVLILLLLYVLSFVKGCSKAHERKEIKTALVNPGNLDSITEINIYDAGNLITIVKAGNYWKAKDGRSDYYLPVSSSKMNNMLNNLTSIRNMYKLSDNFSQNNSFGLTDSATVHLRYTYSQGARELLFGNYDFSQNYRYMMTDRNTTVYEVNSSLDNYLSTSIQNWNEPYLISQEVLGKITEADIQSALFYENNSSGGSIADLTKLLELRHGGTAASAPAGTPDSTLVLEIGNKNRVEMAFYFSRESGDYTVKTTYYDYSRNNKQDFYSRISQWTYNKIREIRL